MGSHDANQPRDRRVPPLTGNTSRGNYARDRQGKIILDRYGRPVPARPYPGQRDSTSLPRGASGVPQTPENRKLPEPPRYVRKASGNTRQHSAQQYQRPNSRTQTRNTQSRTQSQRPQRATRATYPQTQTRKAPSQKSTKPSWSKIWRNVKIALIVFLVLIVGTLFLVEVNLQRTDALAKYPGRVGNTKGTNWLLLGSDSREGLTEEDKARLTAGGEEDSQRADTIIVVHIPRFGGKATMMSIPRDSYVNIPDYGMDKINVSYALGGSQLLQRTLEENTGIRIDHFAEIGFAGFSDIVDSLGGVTLCPEFPIDDPMAGINIVEGCQKFDGPTALGYVRTRYTSARGDLDRVDRQKEFLSAVAKKMTSPGVLLNPFRLIPLIKSLEHALTVNKSDHVWDLMWLGLSIARGADQATIPISGFADYDVGNVAIWDEAGAEELFQSLR